MVDLWNADSFLEKSADVIRRALSASSGSNIPASADEVWTSVDIDSLHDKSGRPPIAGFES